MGDMDSGNSGSLQSSSGGDDDYPSRGPAAVDSFSSFFTPPAPHVTLGSFLPSNPPPPPPPPQSYFDPLATYFDHLSRSNNTDPIWPKEAPARHGPNSMPPSTSDHLQPSSSSAAVKQGRNPRKRTRASRRTPTTVLTTDTSNFRAMVQEFTGIPSPPFGSSAASPSSLLFPRTRFDLFGNPRGGAGCDAPPYLLRPMAQKLPIPHQQPNKNSSGDVMYPDLLFKYPDAGPGLSKPGPASGGGSLELPITIRPNNNNGNDQLEGVTAGFVTASDAASGSGGKSNGGPLVWAEGLGLGADAGPGGASHHQPHNLGFAHQHIG